MKFWAKLSLFGLVVLLVGFIVPLFAIVGVIMIFLGLAIGFFGNKNVRRNINNGLYEIGRQEHEKKVWRREGYEYQRGALQAQREYEDRESVRRPFFGGGERNYNPRSEGYEHALGELRAQEEYRQWRQAQRTPPIDALRDNFNDIRQLRGPSKPRLNNPRDLVGFPRPSKPRLNNPRDLVGFPRLHSPNDYFKNKRKRWL